MTSEFIQNNERLKKLKSKLEFIPETSGVYIHKNQKGEILYVGKAKNLKARLKSYFYGLEQHSLKTKALVEKIVDYEVILTESEYESLLLENNLIKHNLPPYNILLRDDKTYPYIKIDLNEAWPRVILTRRRKKDGNLYFGPYTIPGQIQHLLNIINRFFPLIKCTPSVFKSVSRPCNYYDIKKCLGPCKLAVDKNEYDMHLHNVISILKGNSKKIVQKIKIEMNLASEQQNYEKAIILRDQYKALIGLNQHQSVTLDLPISLDMISFCFSEDLVVFYVTYIRDGKLVGGNSFVIKEFLNNTLDSGSSQENICSSFIGQFYSKNEIPEFVFLSQAENIFLENNLQILNRFLILKKKNSNLSVKVECQSILFVNIDLFLKKIKAIGNYRKIFIDIMNLSIKNAENKFTEQIKIDESLNYLMNDLKKLLKLDFLPRYIECFDISTFQGVQTVASQVAFKDGLSFKSGYKKYIIKDIIGKTDDFSSLREVITRRFKNQTLLPDLLVIDGGTPQVREVAWVLKTLGLEDILLIGLAKSRIKNNFDETHINSSQERIVLPNRLGTGELNPAGECETIILKEGSGAYRLLTQLRDEAHRFAIEFHRKKRDQFTLNSVLFQISGLGAKRRKQLLEVCPKLEQLKSENLNELSKKTKIPLNVLLELKEKLGK